jgi:hypothetical protein
VSTHVVSVFLPRVNANPLFLKASNLCIPDTNSLNWLEMLQTGCGFAGRRLHVSSCKNSAAKKKHAGLAARPFTIAIGKLKLAAGLPLDSTQPRSSTAIVEHRIAPLEEAAKVAQHSTQLSTECFELGGGQFLAMHAQL